MKRGHFWRTSFMDDPKVEFQGAIQILVKYPRTKLPLSFAFIYYKIKKSISNSRCLQTKAERVAFLSHSRDEADDGFDICSWYTPGISKHC